MGGRVVRLMILAPFFDARFFNVIEQTRLMQLIANDIFISIISVRWQLMSGSLKSVSTHQTPK